MEELLNELRNAGAEALSIEQVRAVNGTVVAGEPGALSVEGRILPDPFEISAIGNAETLTGTLTRAGGVIAQIAATDPAAQLTVTPVTSLHAARHGPRSGAGPWPSGRLIRSAGWQIPTSSSCCSATWSGSAGPHPCGGHDWLVNRLGADIGLRCERCGRRVLLERRNLERRFVEFVSRGDPAVTAAVHPRQPDSV